MTIRPAERVAAEVRAELGRQRKTGSDLAAAMGMAQSTVSRRLLGEVAFDVDELHRIAEYLQVPVAQFLGGVAA